MVKEYIIIIQYVGTRLDGSLKMVYESDLRKFKTSQEAIDYGLATRGKDDFNLGALEDDVLIGFRWMRSSLGHDLQEVARAMGIPYKKSPVIAPKL